MNELQKLQEKMQKEFDEAKRDVIGFLGGELVLPVDFAREFFSTAIAEAFEAGRKDAECGCDLERPMTEGEAEIAKGLDDFIEKVGEHRIAQVVEAAEKIEKGFGNVLKRLKDE